MEAIWNRVSDILREKIGEQNLNTWFRPAHFLGVRDQRALLQLPNKFFVEWISENYNDALVESFRSVCGDVSQVQLHVNPSAQGELFPGHEPSRDKVGSQPTRVAEAQPQPRRNNTRFGRLIPKYTFRNFVVGKGNEFSHAASQAVANRPGEHYNPLFIYGGVGLGKTHLLNAIGHRLLERNTETRIGYLSAEAFINEMIACIQRNRMEWFRNCFRKLDVLILDDVQFMAGKEQTQEEFFHTFNVLYESRRQIVLSSDRTPKQISNLEDRLRNRFEWGLIADIQPPDIETRVAILRKKAELEGIALSPDVALFLAERFSANIRELEGALTRLGAFASLAQKPITVEFAREVLKNLVQERKFHVSVDLVQKVVAEQFGVRLNDMKSARRTKNIAFARQVAMYLSRKLTGESLPLVGEKFGKRDHSTVFHAVQVIEKRLKDDAAFQATIARIEGLIESETQV